MTRNPRAIATAKALSGGPAPANTVPPAPAELAAARIATDPLAGLSDLEAAALLNARGEPLDDRLTPNPANAGRWTPAHVRAARSLP